MRSGERIAFEGVADEKIGHTAGDLIFFIQEQADKTFKREGDNLFMNVEIPLVDALVGFTHKFKHLDGHEVTIEVTDPVECDEIQKVRQSEDWSEATAAYRQRSSSYQTIGIRRFAPPAARSSHIPPTTIPNDFPLVASLFAAALSSPPQVKGEGMPRRSGNGFGDLFVTWEVNFPDGLTQAQKDAIEKVLRV
jgi:DnaJ-class molecular chaperone